LAAARAWLQQDAIGAEVELGEEGVHALATLLSTACDGSAVRPFTLPQSLSVECSVRPTE
jgi:hypothetical protein